MFYSQMVELDLSYNDEIDDEGAAMLLECLIKVERLELGGSISPEMGHKLRERGREVGCDVTVLFRLITTRQFS